MDNNAQKDYWNSVANQKVFTHPIDLELFKRFVGESETIIDFGCGYGRIVELLNKHGYRDVLGFDTSIGLVNRGKRNGIDNLFHIESSSSLPLKDDSAQAVLLFAVLTCIPENKHQTALIQDLFSKLRKGGILYISDYYLQDNSSEMDGYEYLNDDINNFGVFMLPEGVTCRHHTKEWILSLVRNFDIVNESVIEVKTMNGNAATAFQLIAQKK